VQKSELRTAVKYQDDTGFGNKTSLVDVALLADLPRMSSATLELKHKENPDQSHYHIQIM
jgi:hypothetical protein